MAQARVIQADWLDAAPALEPASVDLLYADPPFNTGRAKSTPPNASRRDPAAAPLAASFPDRFGAPRDFIAWLEPRLCATLGALKPSANLILHVDWRTSHHARVLLDRLLGPDRFVNHLVWSYGLGGSSPRRFARKHDDLLYYCLRPDAYYFDPPRVPATSRRMAGQTKKATDVLLVPAINNMAAERTGYPTQKPLALLSLLVRACCPPGGTVLDPCCGSGTALVAAVESGRDAVGIDQSPSAAELTARRLGLAPPARPRAIG
ncbi:MAG: hypothetical protein C0475_03180 [Planctomyces sp.]|nr:hypothetical protein [Planctomyces sp.]